eukprot:scaffold248975_cov60-Cyclotella_meneghiniana.AAC.1
MCVGICHTERACFDPTYPFTSTEQAEFFRERTWVFQERKQDDHVNTDFATMGKCMNGNRRLSPEYTWCHQWMVATNVPRGVLVDDGSNNINKSNNSNTTTTTTTTTTTINLHQLESSYNHQNIYPYGAKLPPPGCSRFSEGGGSGSYQHLTLFPQGKLAFCGIPKVSITQWLQFLRFTFGAKDYQVR